MFVSCFFLPIACLFSYLAREPTTSLPRMRRDIFGPSSTPRDCKKQMCDLLLFNKNPYCGPHGLCLVCRFPALELCSRGRFIAANFIRRRTQPIERLARTTSPLFISKIPHFVGGKRNREIQSKWFTTALFTSFSKCALAIRPSDWPL